MLILNILIFTKIITNKKKSSELKKLLIISLLLLTIIGCTQSEKEISKDLLEIKLAGDLSERTLEASGLAWYKNYLIILPQFPHKWDNRFDGALFYIEKERINDYISGKNRKPIIGKRIGFIAKGLDDIGKRKGSGYEAITFVDDTVFVSIESVNNHISTDYVVRGIIDFEKKAITLNADSKKEIKSQTGIHNMGEETILQYRNNIYTIHEANGVNVNSAPHAAQLNFSLTHLEKIPFPNVEYRITDATAPDSSGRFFATNYYYPGEYKKLLPDLPNEKKDIAVERILEFKINNSGIIRTKTEPIILDNAQYKGGRNWEGIVKTEKGFLLITDMYPRTILAYYKL